MSNLIINFTEGTHKIKCKYRHDDQKIETCEIKYKDCERFFKNTIAKGDLIVYK